MKELRGKNAILTGASRGIGVYIAKELAARGVNLVLAARSADKLEDTRRACEALGVRAIAVPCDVASLDELRRLVATAERELGQVDILVNNAGIEDMEEYRYLSIGQIDELLDVNLHAPMRLTKLVLPGMLRGKSGAIVNVASMAGKTPTPYATPYSASKHGLVGFSLSLETELEGTGVTVGVVCPGFVADAGMYADHVAGGSRTASVFAAAVAPSVVVTRVMSAIRHGGQHIAAAGPLMRPIIALGELMPSMKSVLIKRFGVVRLMREEANRQRVGHDRDAAIEAEQTERDRVGAAQ